MHDFRTGPKFITLSVLLMSVVVLPACGGGTTVFQGAGVIPIVGTPPAPPPPPPPPPPKKEDPPPPPARVEIRNNKIEFKEKIQFEVNKSVILPASFSLLDEITKIIKDNAHIKKLAIEGHASSEGDPKRNLTLSDERSKSVMKYIVDKGVDAKRMTAKGFGITKPIADNATEDGKEKNRRVEFNIVEQDITKKKVEIDPKTGKEKVVEESKTTVKEKESEAPKDPAAEKKAEIEKKKAEAEQKAADKKAEAEKKAADKKAEAEKKAAEKKAADEKKAAEKKAADEKAAAEKKAADEKKKP